MIHINCFYEKRLIVAHYFIEQKEIGNTDFTSEDILMKWKVYFPKDYKKLNIGNKQNKVYTWMMQYIKTNSVSDVENDIVSLRRKQKCILYSKFSLRDYRVRMIDVPIESNQIMKYEVLKGKFSRIGNYDNLSRFFDRLIEQLDEKKVS